MFLPSRVLRSSELIVSGEEVGAVYMPAPQTGSPMTYMLDGRRYIVVAVGGGPDVAARLMAFTLP